MTKNNIDPFIEKWRELGFYYETDKQNKSWDIWGSKKGIEKFINILNEYANDPRNDKISEHEHYGPYMYLEIMTWNKAQITSHAIEGTLADIRNLAKIIASKLNHKENLLVIDKEYSDKNEFILKIHIEDDDFDPASKDENIK